VQRARHAQDSQTNRLALTPYRQARERYKKAKKALAALGDPEACSEYWAARQLRKFHCL